MSRCSDKERFRKIVLVGTCFKDGFVRGRIWKKRVVYRYRAIVHI